MSENSSYSPIFYSLIVSGAVGVLGSAYYIYSLLDSSNTLAKEKSICKDPEISLTYKGKLTQERAMKLMAIIHNRAEDYILKKRPDIEDLRRTKINESQAYEEIIIEMNHLKSEAFSKFTSEIEATYGYTYEEITKVLENVCPIEMEEKLSSYSIPKFGDQRVFNNKFVIDAFVFYANRYIEHMKITQGLPKSTNTEDQKQELIYNLMIGKYKADDELFLKYHITEHQLKYLLFENKLHSEKQIQDLLFTISEYEQMFQ